MKNQVLVMAASLSLALLGTTAAYAKTNANEEISTAITHAGFAEKMTDVNKVHQHLHHVINCLVGPHGAGFDAKAGDPCLGMGNGAIDDFTYKMADKVRRDLLKEALEDANYGLMTSNPQIARNAAELAQKDLKESQENL